MGLFVNLKKWGSPEFAGICGDP